MQSVTIDNGEELDAQVAEVVANAMKDWAIEKGATHYTHWFQPMTGVACQVYRGNADMQASLTGFAPPDGIFYARPCRGDCTDGADRQFPQPYNQHQHYRNRPFPQHDFRASHTDFRRTSGAVQNGQLPCRPHKTLRNPSSRLQHTSRLLTAVRMVRLSVFSLCSV